MKIIFITVLIILLILFIGELIYANIRLYQGIKDEHKSIDWMHVIFCIGIFLLEILLISSVFINN